ncbi:MAG: hypothetical protein ACTSR8_02835 [Promethearchaeota archaeon]
MSEKSLVWTIKLDWLNILGILNLRSIHQIPELKIEKALKKITKYYSTEILLEMEPEELDTLIAGELKELMKKELTINAKRREKIEKDLRSKVIPFKQGGIIKIDPRDFKDLDPDAEPEEIFKFLSKKFFGRGDDDNEDEDDDVQEDSSGFYI